MYDRAMPSEERIHAGHLLINGDTAPLYAELWARGNKVVVFMQPGARVWGVVTEATYDHDDKGRLKVTGLHDGEPIEIVAAAEARTLATWTDANVQFNDGTNWPKSTVLMTSYGVVVKHKNERRVLAAHRTNEFQRVGYIHGPHGIVANVQLAAVRSCCGR